jgi:hypothetical protein
MPVYTPRVKYTFKFPRLYYPPGLIFLFFNVNFVFMDRARARLQRMHARMHALEHGAACMHAATPTQLLAVSTATPMEPLLVETMLVRMSCLSPCLLV